MMRLCVVLVGSYYSEMSQLLPACCCSCSSCCCCGSREPVVCRGKEFALFEAMRGPHKGK
jgi:hypothetical protein